MSVLAEKQQVAEDRRFLADYDSEVRTRTAAAVLEHEGQQEHSNYAGMVEQSVSQIGPSVLKEFEGQGYTPSPDARVRAEVGFTGLLTNTRVSAMTDQHNAKVAAALRGIQNNADVHLNVLEGNPSRETLEATQDAIRETLGQAEGLADPDVLARLQDDYQGRAYKSYVAGLITNGRLGAARRELSSDEANEMLDPNDKIRLRDGLEREARAVTARVERGVQTSLDALTDVAGVTTPSTEMVEAAREQIGSLPPSLQAPYRAKLNAIVAVGKQSRALLFAPPEQQQALLSSYESAINAGGVTSSVLEQYKATQDIIKRSERQRANDATVQTIGAGAGDATTAPPDMANADYRDESAALANATAARFGPGVQVLPRPMFDQVKAALTTGSVEEAYSAIAFLGDDLGLAAREAVLTSLGSAVSPSALLAMDNAADRPQLARDLIAADKAEKETKAGGKVTLPSNNDLILKLEGDVGTAFADNPALFTTTLAAAKALTAQQVGAGTAYESDLTTTVVENFKVLTEGRIVDYNGRQILLPAELLSTPKRPTEAIVEDRLRRMETVEQWQKAVVPAGPNGAPIDLTNAKLLRVEYENGEVVPLDDLADAPLGGSIAPGVYGMTVDGFTPGAPYGVYEHEWEGTTRTDRFPLALSFPAVLGLTETDLVVPQAETPENVRVLEEAVRRAAPGSRERFDLLQQLRDARGAARGTPEATRLGPGGTEERNFLASATPSSSSIPVPRVRPEKLAERARTALEGMADGEFVMQVTAGASGLARFGLQQTSAPLADAIDIDWRGDGPLGEFISGRPEQISALKKLDPSGRLAEAAVSYSRRSGKAPGSIQLTEAAISKHAERAKVPFSFAQRYTLQHELVHKGLQDLWLYANRPDTPEVSVESGIARSILKPRSALDYRVGHAAHHVVTEMVAVKALLDTTNGQSREDLGYAMRLIDSIRESGAAPLFLTMAIAMDKAQGRPGYQLNEGEVEAMETIYRGLKLTASFYELAPPQKLFDAIVELEALAAGFAQ
jgi:hypothetical protein